MGNEVSIRMQCARGAFVQAPGPRCRHSLVVVTAGETFPIPFQCIISLTFREETDEFGPQFGLNEADVIEPPLNFLVAEELDSAQSETPATSRMLLGIVQAERER